MWLQLAKVRVTSANTVRTFRSSSAVPSGDGKIHAGIGSPFLNVLKHLTSDYLRNKLGI
jgi:hypothetical protein